MDNGLTLVLKRVPKINIALEKEDRKKKGDKSPRNAAGDMVVEDVASSSAADSSVQSSVEEEATPAVTELTSTVDSKDEPKKPAASPAKREKDWDESSSEEEDEPPPKEPVKPADGGGGTKNSDDGAKESDDAADEDAWLAIFNGAFEYLMLSLAHEDCVGACVRLLGHLCASARLADALFGAPEARRNDTLLQTELFFPAPNTATASFVQDACLGTAWMLMLAYICMYCSACDCFRCC